MEQPELSHKRAYTRIGLYRGNIVAIKLVYKRSIDITRNIRKELKQVSLYLCTKLFHLSSKFYVKKCIPVQSRLCSCLNVQ